MSDLSIFGDFSPELTNIWRFDPPAPDDPAGLPPALLDNLLYYYTQPGDVVFDPFAGSGVTLAVCQQRQRRCYVSDLTPASPAIRQWDSTQGLPDDLPVPDLVFLDPPYWQPDPEQYNDNPSDLAKVSLAVFLKTLGDLAKAVKRKWGAHRPKARLALLTGMAQVAGQYVDLPLLAYTEISKYLTLELRYQVPYTGAVAPDIVQQARDGRQCLYLFRDLLVFKWDAGAAD
ncbi:MAG TPA: DNA methyltransferase [Anaerolineae bacterium]|nr:DNA methyltransferase [Anaerolineae bacterium]